MSNSDLSTTKELSKLNLIAEVARLYYEYDLTQMQIAKKLFISRPTVSKLLKQAKEKGLVEIKINYVFERCLKIEERLKSLFNLNEALVLNSCGKNYKEVLAEIGQLGAKYLQGRINQKLILGMSWGNTVFETVSALHIENKVPIDVVQIMGVASVKNPKIDARELIRNVAELYGGTSYYLNAPLYIEDEYVLQAIKRDPIISETLNKAYEADIVLTGIGDMGDNNFSQPWLGYMSNKTFNEIKAQKAVGFICAHFFDKDGKEIDNLWNKRCVGIDLNGLKAIPEVIVVAGGRDKSNAILGGLRGGYINVLITDYENASAIISKA